MSSKNGHRYKPRYYSLWVAAFLLPCQALLIWGFAAQRSRSRQTTLSRIRQQLERPPLLTLSYSRPLSLLFSVLPGKEQNSTSSSGQPNLSSTSSSSSSSPSPSIPSANSPVRANSREMSNMVVRDESDDERMDSAERRRLLQEAQVLRERARKLREEADAEEAYMKQSRATLQSKKSSERDGMIAHLFQHPDTVAKLKALCNASDISSGDDVTNNNNTFSQLTPQQVQLALATEIANRLRSERWSPEQVIVVLERLHERQVQVQVPPVILTPSQAAVLVNRPAFQIGDTRNAASTGNETEWNLLDFWIASLVDAAAILDKEHDNAGYMAATQQQQQRVETSAGDDRDGEKEQASILSAQPPAESAPVGSVVEKNPRWTGRVASALKSRRKELIKAQEEELKRRIAANVNAVANAAVANPPLDGAFISPFTPPGTLDIQEYTRQTLGMAPKSSPPTEQRGKREFNITKAMERIAMVPMWVPSSLLPYLLSSGATLRKEDVAIIKGNVLMGSSKFFCTSSDAIPSAAVFRGNIRAPNGAVVDTRNHSAAVFEEIQQRLKKEGLSERVQLFFLEDPEWRPGKDSRTPKALPVILAIAKKVEPVSSAMEALTTNMVARRAAVALTLIATMSFSVSCFALNPTFFDAVVNQNDLSVLIRCIPLALGILAVHAIHESAHYLVARIRGIKLGRPTPLPSLQLGSFGCITPLLSFPPNRSALFDLALSGPVAGMAVSLLMMVGGIHATIGASELALQNFPVLPIGLFKSSLLSGTLMSIFAPKTMMLPLAQPVPIHPLFISGFVGLFSNALNLLPIFRLDGGRLCTAVCGTRFGGVASASTLLFMLSLTISGSSGIALSFGLLVILLQRRTEVPARDEVTQVDDVRVGGWLASLVAALLALAPFPGGPGFL